MPLVMLYPMAHTPLLGRPKQAERASEIIGSVDRDLHEASLVGRLYYQSVLSDMQNSTLACFLSWALWFSGDCPSSCFSLSGHHLGLIIPNRQNKVMWHFCTSDNRAGSV